MKKKITALALVICLLAVAVVGGTMAYFTDTDEATNTFTVGNVKIELEEKMATSSGYFPSGLVDWEEQELVPSDEVNYNKVVLVKNTGANDAFVRLKVRYEKVLEPVLTVYSELAGWDASLAYGGKTDETIDGKTYVVETFYTTSPVKAGTYFSPQEIYDANSELTHTQMLRCALVTGVALDPSFDWFMPDTFEGAFSYTGDNGKTHIAFNDYGMPDFTVDVIAEAIQADGFDNYTAAFAAFDAQK